jgi:glycine/D-amino acid oxidase-like deaminating enzyme
MTKYGRSPWIDAFPKSRVPSYPRQRGSLSAPVVIVGGGLAGCATAYAFAASGVDVMLVEANQVGRGVTGLTSGWIGGDPGVSFTELEKTAGRAAARDVFRAWRRAALDFVALVRRLDIKCAFAPQGGATVALTPDQAARLKREHAGRQAAGIDAPMMSARVVKSELGLDAAAAVREDAGGLVDPYRLCIGLAAAAAERGATIFERTAVRKITFDRRNVDLITTEGAIHAGCAIIATGMPTPLFKSLMRHFWFQTSCLAMTERIPAKIRHQLGRREMVVRDRSEPPHMVRWVDGEQLLISGADAASPPLRQRERFAVQRTGQLMYELSTLYPDISGILPEYGWDAAYARTADGVPYLGPHRNFPHHLFAFGDSSRGITGAYLASRVLLRHYLGELESADRHFDFTRHGR